ncbi:acyltransferase family protein [Blastococcus sp. SYSU D00922]
MPGLPLQRPGRVSRRDIQGLRAVAVGLVVLYHLRPDQLPGGFIGVDVFFVISGFLIVGSLGREVARTGTISLRGFYARRARRLLPAATCVLVAVMAATVALMPVSRWAATAEALFASVLQVQNWWQAATSGYAAATAAVSPVQHYWSLAVEEQFYVVAPVLLLVAAWLATRLGRARRAAIVSVVAGLAAVSFVHSVTFTAASPEVAYFATSTRMWELAAGGVLALLGDRLRLPDGLRTPAAVLGLSVIAGASVTFSTHMDFPGWVALAPVLGSALVILSGAPSPSGAAAGRAQRLLGSPVPRYVGDISYSLYLWHWPVIVFWIAHVGRPPTKVECAVLLVVLLALAHLSTRYVEEPFRRPRPARGARRSGSRSSSGALRLAVALTTVAVIAGAGPWLYVQQRTAALGGQLLDARHPGGAAPLPGELPPDAGVPVIPDPVVAAQDIPFVNGNGCAAFDPRSMGPDSCVFADVGSPLTVVLAGDSHAGQFSTPLLAVAERQGWRLQTMVRNGCPFTAAPILIGGEADWDCAAANQVAVQRLLEKRPQVVVTTAMRPAGYESALGWSWNSEEDLVAGYRTLWAPLLEAGVRVVVVRDTPTPDYVGPECVERNGPTSAACSMTRAEVEQQSDPLLEAAGQVDGVHVIDLTDHLCNARICPGVVGNVLVYRDNHLTDTFALSLAPALEQLLVDLV